MDQQLLVGVLLIIVGLAIGLIAVALVMNRRAARGEQPPEAPVPQEVAEGLQPEPDVPAATQGEAAPAAVSLPEEPKPESAPSVPEEPKPESAPSVPEEPKPATAGLVQPKLVAEIYRDERSGGLILRTAGRDYRAISQIEDEQLRMDLSILASDLTAAPPSEPRTPARPGSRSMLEGINSILQRALADAGNKAKGVQLVPDAAGGVKVLIGLKSYALDEVPDEEIRRLIRESVAEWEAGQ